MEKNDKEKAKKEIKNHVLKIYKPIAQNESFLALQPVR